MIVKIAVLVSGGGTNLQALIDAQNNGALGCGRIVQVISSSKDAFALERARSAGIRADVADIKTFPDNAAFEKRLTELLNETMPSVVVLAGFMHILSADFLTVSRWENRIINIHPSLIPAFCGKGFYGLKVHEAVLRSGAKVTGATVHIVTDVPDGGPILMQKAVDVLPDDTPKTLQRRVMEQAEWVILPKAVSAVCDECAARDGYRVGAMKYPGRGIIIGTTPSGKSAFAYFIMGRSAGSRARVFEKNGTELLIKLLDPSKVNDPSLVLYKPVRMINGKVIVTNGDQTDTIYDAVKNGGTFEDALRTREYEPDPPHYTPRISGIISLDSYCLSILKSDAESIAELAVPAERRPCKRQFFDYENVPGEGRLIHTYDGERDGTLISFSGEPRAVSIPDDIDMFADGLWRALDADNKVSLYVRFTSKDGGFADRLFNKYGAENDDRA